MVVVEVVNHRRRCLFSRRWIQCSASKKFVDIEMSGAIFHLNGIFNRQPKGCRMKGWKPVAIYERDIP